MSYCVLKVETRTHKRMFLKFPSIIYKNDINPQSYDTEKSLLAKTHWLSDDISFDAFLVIDDEDCVVARCALTKYHTDDCGYLGFFETQDNFAAVKALFDYVEAYARAHCIKKIIGPIDTSIYIRYRFKIDRFDKVYTGEPYNKPYYHHLWEQCGYTICSHYSSNQLRQVRKSDVNPKLEKIMDRYLHRGYIICTPTKQSFSSCLEDVYHLMMDTYSEFDGFKPIPLSAFMAMYEPLQKIANFDMIKLAYDNNFVLRAFCICLPNYNGLTHGDITIRKINSIVNIKKCPQEYVVLYLGADKCSAGLGSVLVQAVRNELYCNKCTSIGALIKDGNLTGKLYEDLYTDKFQYVLLSKTL